MVTPRGPRAPVSGRPSNPIAGVVPRRQVPLQPPVKLDPWGGVGDRLQNTFAMRAPDVYTRLQDRLGRVEALLADSRARMTPNNTPTLEGQALRDGAAAGRLHLDPQEASAAVAQGHETVFVLRTLDAQTIDAALTAKALLVPDDLGDDQQQAVARLGKPTVVLSTAQLDGLEAGRMVTVDGTQGRVALGLAPLVTKSSQSELNREIAQLRADYTSKVTAEASTVAGIEQAVALGADKVRIDVDALLANDTALPYLRRYLMATEAGPKRAALEHLSAAMREQAQTLLTAAGTTEATFALGSRAPHTYFPARAGELDALAASLQVTPEVARERVADLGAGNSKLGLRGARWAVKDPELFAAIGRGLFEAQADLLERGEPRGPLDILIPSVSVAGELTVVKGRLEREREAVAQEYALALPVSYSAGIDTARGALSAATISQQVSHLEYSLWGLTETLFGISKDDAHSFMPQMIEAGIAPSDPFTNLDSTGVGEMVKVGQYLAGDAPNSFSASIAGPQALDSNGLLLARGAGVDGLTVPFEKTLQARLADAGIRAALASVDGLHVPASRERDQSSKVFDILTGDAVRTPKAAPPSGLPEGITPLEFVDGLITEVTAGSLSTREALMKVPVDLVDALARPTIDPTAKVTMLADGIAASPGSGQGRVALSAEMAAEYERAGEPYVLLVTEVHAEDVTAVRKSKGLISVRGGKTSHGAMIAANSDVPCVLNERIRINLEGKSATIGRKTVKEGEWVTIDGTKGRILEGKTPLLDPSAGTAFETLMSWTDEHRSLKVLANADTPDEAGRAFQRGAEGVGLVRSEHMFYEADRLPAFRSVILSEPGARPADIATLEKAQTDDYRALFETAQGKKVAVRLLDPPLYEFLPQRPEEIDALSHTMGVPRAEVVRRINGLHEVDSMLGLRGVRLALVRPDIEAMQVRALSQAYVQALRAGHRPAPLSIIVPQLSSGAEMRNAKARIEGTVAAVAKETGVDIPIELGAMIETPRGALDAAEIAKHASFFSYGTNDLTQTTLGYGRNVAAKFVPDLIEARALESDPTGTLDKEGVGRLIQVAQFLGRDTRPTCPGGVCGGQGGDPESIRITQALGLNYVPVPPAQVSKARLAAAQAAISADLTGGEKTAPELIDRLAKAQNAVHHVPLGLSEKHVIDHLELLTRQSGALLAEAEGASLGDRLELLPLMKAQHSAVGVLDFNGILTALGTEIQNVAEFLKYLTPATTWGPIKESLDVPMRTAKAAHEAMETAYNAQRRQGTTSSSEQRELLSHAWAALRGLEAVRAQVQDVGLFDDLQNQHRLRHINDAWDNNHYTRRQPSPGQPFGDYLKQVSHDFLKDNNIRTELSGAEKIPTDRPVIYAISHRSGAIDRFVAMATLPIDGDRFAYVVRPDSPLDRIATQVYGPANRWVVPAKSRDEMIGKVEQSLAQGATSVIVYPQGTGTLSGESLQAASSIGALATKTNAYVVPVTIDDTFRLTPFGGGRVTVHVENPIDPAAVKRELERRGDGAQADDAIQTLLQYELDKGFRSIW